MNRSLVKDNTGLVLNSTSLLAAELDYCLIDGSGSMIHLWDDVLGCLNSYFTTIRAGHLNSHGIVQVFDSGNLEDIQRDSTIGSWPKFNRGNMDLPGGGTPLFDAINIMGRRLGELAPTKCSIVIGTDGANTRSTTSEVQARAVLDWCRAQGWQVVFIGFDFNNNKMCTALGADKQTFIGVQKARLHEAGEALANKRLRYSRTDADMGFSDDEKKDFGGYLAAPK